MSQRYLTEEARWRAVIARDAQAAEAFVYAVTTTGIYCRPGCASRRPKRDHVRFFDDWQAAEAAGFRPCRRCQPQQADKPDPHRQAMITACRMIEEAQEPPLLNDLASAVGLSPSHFHRLFKARLGVTPKQYAMEHRLDRLRHALPQSERVTDAIYEAGYGSSSRAYEQVTAKLGMQPAARRRSGEGEAIRYAVVPCDLGWALVAATEQGICAIDLGDEPQALEAELRQRFARAHRVEADAVFQRWVAQVLRLLEQPGADPELPLDIRGTAFQRRVWQALRQIPAGTTASYGEIAAQLGQPKAARAVARACATNPLAVAIPCHRVVRRDGQLGGYRWGLPRKRELLAREAVAATSDAEKGG